MSYSFISTLHAVKIPSILRFINFLRASSIFPTLSIRIMSVIRYNYPLYSVPYTLQNYRLLDPYFTFTPKKIQPIIFNSKRKTGITPNPLIAYLCPICYR
jgi:hypothetical protein